MQRKAKSSSTHPGQTAGLVLVLFNVSPKDVYGWAGETGRTVFTWLWAFGQRIGPYALMGAMLVVPLWGVTFLWKKFKGRS